MKPSLAAWSAALVLSSWSPFAPAALVDRGAGMVYDSVQDLTWLAAPAALAGPLTWTEALTWTAALAHGGADHWRLPTTLQPDASCSDAFDVGFGLQTFGVGCTGSELGHLFHVDLGGRPYESVFEAGGDSAKQIANVGLFPLLADGAYWSSTLSVSHAAAAWMLRFDTGQLLVQDVATRLYVLAVHDGDVGAATPVPAPSVLALAVLALGLVRAVPRRAGPQPDQPAL